MTFDLLICKWGHGLPVFFASFLPIIILLCPFILNLGSGTGQTGEQTVDGQTDRQKTAINALCPTLWDGGHKTIKVD